MFAKFARKIALWGSVAIATAPLWACAQPPQTLLPGLVEPSSPAANAEQRRAARALSVGNVTTIASDADPFQRALVCAIAVGDLAVRLEKSRLLDGQQDAAVKQVARFYANQSASLAAQQGKAGQSYEQARRDEAARQNGSALSAQTAIGCLRNAAATMD